MDDYEKGRQKAQQGLPLGLDASYQERLGYDQEQDQGKKSTINTMDTVTRASIQLGDSMGQMFDELKLQTVLGRLGAVFLVLEVVVFFMSLLFLTGHEKQDKIQFLLGPLFLSILFFDYYLRIFRLRVASVLTTICATSAWVLLLPSLFSIFEQKYVGTEMQIYAPIATVLISGFLHFFVIKDYGTFTRDPKPRYFEGMPNRIFRIVVLVLASGGMLALLLTSANNHHKFDKLVMPIAANTTEKTALIIDTTKAELPKKADETNVSENATKLEVIANQAISKDPDLLSFTENEARIIDGFPFLSSDQKNELKREFRTINGSKTRNLWQSEKHEALGDYWAKLDYSKYIQIVTSLDIKGSTEDEADKIALNKKKISAEDIDGLPYLTDAEKQKIKSTLKQRAEKNNSPAVDYNGLANVIEFSARVDLGKEKLDEIMTKLGWVPIVIERREAK